MHYAQQKPANIIFALGVTAFLLTGFLGLSHFGMTMNMDRDITMSDCPFMSGMAICNMSVFDHIAAWQSMFAHILPHYDSTTVFLLLLSVSLLVLGWIKQPYPLPNNRLKQFKHFFGPEYVPKANPLQDLFSNGILNPKLF